MDLNRINWGAVIFVAFVAVAALVATLIVTGQKDIEYKYEGNITAVLDYTAAGPFVSSSCILEIGGKKQVTVENYAGCKIAETGKPICSSQVYTAATGWYSSYRICQSDFFD